MDSSMQKCRLFTDNYSDRRADASKVYSSTSLVGITCYGDQKLSYVRQSVVEYRRSNCGDVMEQNINLSMVDLQSQYIFVEVT